MNLQVIGAGLPRTGTASLKVALEHLLGCRCYHMREIPDHPFNLGVEWDRALAGDLPDWDKIYGLFCAGVDWPTAMFWRELADANPNALILLSKRHSAEEWLASFEATILPVAREALAPGWKDGRGLITLLERFTETNRWDDPASLTAAYERHNASVRESIPRHQLLEWHPADGWDSICHALNLPLPDFPFPWTNRKSDWA